MNLKLEGGRGEGGGRGWRGRRMEREIPVISNYGLFQPSKGFKLSLLCHLCNLPFFVREFFVQLSLF